jgi:uncharacterized membrane protein
MIKKYETMVKNIQNEKMEANRMYALLSYVLMVLGLYVFVLPNIENFNDIFIYGSLFGFIVYGVYDFVCASIFKKWDKKLMILDILWGTFIYTFIAFMKFKIG